MCGIITLKQLVKKLAKLKIYVPKHIFNFFVNTLVQKDSENFELSGSS
jgi:hypothetical protein